MRRLLGKAARTAAFPGQYRRFKMLSKAADNRFDLKWRDRYPCLDDLTASVPFSHHYLYHMAWAARVLLRTRPGRHVDFSSHVHFVGIMSGVIEIDYYEFRRPDIQLDNLHCHSADLTALPFEDQSLQSISCMHVMEHLGLGRYGDPLDPGADLVGMRELRRVLAVGGNLLFVVPVGRPRVEFNAHRVYSWQQVIDGFPGLELHRFALIKEAFGGSALIDPATREMADREDHGCGCFWFRKTAPMEPLPP